METFANDGLGGFVDLDYKPLLYEGRCTITTVYSYNPIVFCIQNVFVFVGCPCMATNVSVQYNVGFLHGIILLTQCYYHRGTRLKAMKRFLICSL